MTTEDTDVLGRQRSSEIKAKSGQPTCKNCHYNATQHCSTETCSPSSRPTSYLWCGRVG